MTLIEVAVLRLLLRRTVLTRLGRCIKACVSNFVVLRRGTDLCQFSDSVEERPKPRTSVHWSHMPAFILERSSFFLTVSLK